MGRFHVAACGVFGLLSAVLFLQPAGAQEGALCEAAQGPAPTVSLIVLASPERVHTLAASIRGVAVVRRGEKTVVFEDGRIITADVTSVGGHLAALGWTERKIEVMASFKPRAARPRRYG